MQYANNPRSNVTLVMLPGNHDLSVQLSVSQAPTFNMVAFYNVTSSPTITCSGSGRLVLNDIQDVKVIRLTFVRCGGNTADSVDNLLLENSHFMGATQQENDTRGAWIVTMSTNLTMINCTFTNNIATGIFGTGGAMNIDGIKNLTVQGCTFTNNQVSRDSSGAGGALAITAAVDSTLNISECAFKNNQVNGPRGLGGALSIIVRNSAVTITGCTISSNQISDSRGQGGAVYIGARNSRSMISLTLFENNQLREERSEGGALFIDSETNSTNIISECTFVNNQVEGNFGTGGAMHISGKNTTQNTIRLCSFISNLVAGDNGIGGSVIIRGIENSSNFVSECTFTNNGISSTQGDGGALFVGSERNSKSTISICTFTSNHINASFGDGGALFVSSASNSSSTVNMCLFIGNLINGSRGAGGAMFVRAVEKSAIFVGDCTFRNNKISDSNCNGGAVSITITDSAGTVNTCSFLNNQVNGPFGQGGALSINSGSTNSIGSVNGCTFSNNQVNGTHSDGGALYINAGHGHTMINESTFTNNWATGREPFGDGGAVYAIALSRVTVQGSTFRSNGANSSSGLGGALYVDLPIIDLKECEFTNNQANEQGGAVYVRRRSSPGEIRVFGCQYSENTKEAIYGSDIRAISVNQSSFIRNINGRAAIYVAINTRNLATSSELESQVLVSESTFNGNDGAIESTNIKQISISSTFTNHTRNQRVLKFQGTGLSNNKAVITQCIFDNNKGGVIYNHNMSILVNESTFIKNTIDSEAEGIVYITGYNTNVTFSNSLFSTNRATVCGILRQTATQWDTQCGINFISNTFSNNTATGYFLGGGVGCFENAIVTIVSNTFNNNTANNNGGVFNVNTSTVNIITSTFTNNSALNSGGVAHIVNSAMTTMDTTFDHNMASRIGGTISLDNSNLTAVSTTFLNSNAGSNGGLLYAFSSSSPPKRTLIEISQSRLSETVAAIGGGILYAQNCIIDVAMERNCLNFSNATENGTLAAIFNTTLSVAANSNSATPGGNVYICNGSRITGSITQSSEGRCTNYDIANDEIGTIVNQEEIATCFGDLESISERENTSNVHPAIIASLSICGILILSITLVALIVGIVIKRKKTKRIAKSPINSTFMLQGKIKFLLAYTSHTSYVANNIKFWCYRELSP
jgi:predicted outer membrane repeat protein